jgi:hypothetical protein
VRASEAGRHKACLDAAVGNELAVEACPEHGRTVAVAPDGLQAFKATYGDVQQWPVSILLVCILPPFLFYGLIRFALFVLSAAVPPAQAARKQT